MSQTNPNSITPPTVVKATLAALGKDGKPTGTPITVHFNPSSLVYTVQGSSPQKSGDPNRRQYAAIFTGKLTMDLQFDATDTGSDVRTITSQVAMFMQSSSASNKLSANNNDNGQNPPAPPVLSFDWGAYHFQGYMESFRETIDFFSADGIPLRSLVSIGLAQQNKTLSTVQSAGSNTSNPSTLVPTSGTGPGAGQDENTSSNGPGSSGTSITAFATQGGDANASRALASANNIENPRFTGGAILSVSNGIQLNPAVGFATSTSASAGVSGGLGLSLTGGVGVSSGTNVSGGAGVSFGIGASVSSSAGGQVALATGGGALFGSSASAGVPATQGAFSGLERGRAVVSTTAQLDPSRMLPSTVGSDVSAGAGASFGLGGIALAQAGFSANVGVNSSLTDRLTFDGD